jgi:hypothetical protein
MTREAESITLGPLPPAWSYLNLLHSRRAASVFTLS